MKYNITRTVAEYDGNSAHRDIDVESNRENSRSNKRDVKGLTSSTNQYASEVFATNVTYDTSDFWSSLSVTQSFKVKTQVRKQATGVTSSRNYSLSSGNHHTGTWQRGYSVTNNYTNQSLTSNSPDGRTIVHKGKSNYSTSNHKGVFNGFVGEVQNYRTEYKPEKAGEGDTLKIYEQFGGSSHIKSSETLYAEKKLSKWQSASVPSYMDEGNLDVTTLTELSYSDYSTHTTSRSYREDGKTLTEEIVETCTTERSTFFKFRTIDTERVLTYDEDDEEEPIKGNKTAVEEFNFSADSPFHSFLICEDKEYNKLINNNVSHKFKATLCKEIEGGKDDPKTIAILPAERFDLWHEYPRVEHSTRSVGKYWSTFSYITKFEANANIGQTKGTTATYWEKVYIDQCGYTFKPKPEIMLPPAEHESFIHYTQQSSKRVKYFGLAAQGIPRQLVEGLTYEDTKVGLQSYKTRLSNGNTISIDHTTVRSTVRYTGTIHTGSETSDTDATRTAQTIEIPAEAGRKVRYLYDTVSTSASSRAYSSTTAEELAIGEWKYNLTYITYKALHYFSIKSELCFTGETYPYGEPDPVTFIPYRDTETASSYGVCHDLRVSQRKIDYEQRFQRNISRGQRTSPAGIPFDYLPVTSKAFSTFYHRCGREEIVKTTKATRVVPSNDSYRMHFNAGYNLSSSKLFDTNWVSSKTITYKAVVSEVGDTPYLQQEYLTSSGYDKWQSTLSGMSTTLETSGELHTTGSGSATNKVLYKVNGKYSTSIRQYTTSTERFNYSTLRDSQILTTVWNAGTAIGNAGNTNKMDFTYQYVVKQARYAHDAVLKYVYRQYYLDVYEPVIRMQNHWQDGSDYGVGKPYYTNFENKDYIPVRQGGAHYGGFVGGSPYYHPSNTEAYHAAQGYRRNAANLPILDTPYFIFSSSRTYTAERYTNDRTEIVTLTNIDERSSTDMPVFTYNSATLTQFTNGIGITAFTPTNTTGAQSTEKMFNIAKMNSFSSTKFDTYSSTTSTKLEDETSSKSTKFIASKFTYDRPIIDTYIIKTAPSGNVNDRLFFLGINTVSPMGNIQTYYESAYSNKRDLPYNALNLPVRPMYAIGGALFNGREKSATIRCDLVDAEVEMFYTEYNNGKKNTVSQRKQFDFSFTTAGSRVSHIRAVQALEYETADKGKAVNLNQTRNADFMGGSPDMVLKGYNGCMVAIPQLPEVRLGTQKLIGHDPSIVNTVSTEEES